MRPGGTRAPAAADRRGSHGAVDGREGEGHCGREPGSALLCGLPPPAGDRNPAAMRASDTDGRPGAAARIPSASPDLHRPRRATMERRDSRTPIGPPASSVTPEPLSRRRRPAAMADPEFRATALLGVESLGLSSSSFSPAAMDNRRRQRREEANQRRKAAPEQRS